MSFYFDFYRSPSSSANSFGEMFQDCSPSPATTTTDDCLNSLSGNSRNGGFSSDECSPKSEASFISGSNLPGLGVKTNDYEDKSGCSFDDKTDLIDLLKDVSEFSEMSNPLSNETGNYSFQLLSALFWSIFFDIKSTYRDR